MTRQRLHANYKDEKDEKDEKVYYLTPKEMTKKKNRISSTGSDDVTATTGTMTMSTTASKSTSRRRRRRRKKKQIVNLVPCLDWKPNEAQLKWAQFRLKCPSESVGIYQTPISDMDIPGATLSDGDTSLEENDKKTIPSRQLSRGRRALLRVSQRHALQRSRRIQQFGYRMQPEEENDEDDSRTLPSRLKSVSSSSAVRLYANGRLISPPAPTDKAASWLIHLPKPIPKQSHSAVVTCHPPPGEYSDNDQYSPPPNQISSKKYLSQHQSMDNNHEKQIYKSINRQNKSIYSDSKSNTYTIKYFNSRQMKADNDDQISSHHTYHRQKISNSSKENASNNGNPRSKSKMTCDETSKFIKQPYDYSMYSPSTYITNNFKRIQYGQSQSNKANIQHFDDRKSPSNISNPSNDSFGNSTKSSNNQRDTKTDDECMSIDQYYSYRKDQSDECSLSPTYESFRKKPDSSHDANQKLTSNIPNNYYGTVSDDDFHQLRKISSEELYDSNEDGSSSDDHQEWQHYITEGTPPPMSVIDSDGNLSEVIQEMMLSPTILTKRFQQAVTAIQTHSWDQVAYLLMANPWLAEMVDVRNEQYLLHQLALHSCPDHDLIQTLWENMPSAVFKLDSQGNLPLHMAAMSGNTHMISLLGAQFSSAASVQNHDGHIPLHLALLTQQSRIVVSNLIELDPSSRYIADADGNTPLHLTVIHYKGDIAYGISRLLDETGSKNNLGQTALQCALLHSVGWQVVEQLREGIKDCPDALFMAIRGTDPKTVLSIIQTAPELVSRADSNGIYPIQVAIQNQLSFNILLSIALVDMPGPTWYYLTCQSDDQYLNLVEELLIRTDQPIRILCSYRGPHKKAVLDKASSKCQKLLLYQNPNEI